LLNKKGKIQAKGIIIIIVFILAAITIGILGWWYRGHNLPDTDKMIITQNEDFNEYRLPGIGTKEDPYRIENYNKNDFNRIEISDTTKFFIIKNCEFVCISEETIAITNVASETAIIYNNNFNQEKYLAGNYIHITDSPNCSILNNRFFSIYEVFTMSGLQIENSSSTNICGNYMNSLYEGIILEHSDFSNISNNNFIFGSMEDNAIKVYRSNNVSITENSIHNAYTGIICKFSDYAFMSKNNIQYCFHAFELDYLDYCTFYLNEINFSSIAINTWDVDNSIISNNIIGQCSLNGIRLYLCHYNNITYNSFVRNHYHGLRLDSSTNNTIWNNNFIENNIDGYDYSGSMYYQQAFDSRNNDWHIDTLTLGNYWSDLIWNITATYPIDAGSNVDFHPLEFPV